MSDNVHSGLDLPAARTQVLASYADLIKNARHNAAMLWCYQQSQDREEPILAASVKSRPYHTFDELYQSCLEMWYMATVLKARTTIFAFVNEVQFTEQTRDALVLVVVTRLGFETHCWPWHLDEQGEVVWEEDAVVDPTGPGIYPVRLGNIFPVYATIDHFAISPREVMRWLSALGHEVKLESDFTFANVDPRSGM